MITQTLRDARKYEEEAEREIGREDRPEFHLSPRAGWMNDPNGFSYYRGEYHLFYQYYPYAAHWDSMHWGHAVSRDLLRWRYLPAALAPDIPSDRDGCFSGSAIELEDGRQLLMYTGIVNETGPDGRVRCVQTQNLALGDGTDYEKYSANPVLDSGDLPEGASKYDFRDPKIWREDGVYYCVTASCDGDQDGQILLYSSRDGLKWNYETILEKNNGRYGKVWECPDFFELDGKHVLLVSPMDMLPQDFEYHNGNGTLCLIGSYDKEKKKFTAEHNQATDYGIDFYATQTMLTPDGRRVMIAWMQNWDTCNLHKPTVQWQGQMTVPRELSVVNGRLIQKPIRELEAMRRNKVEYRKVRFTDILRLEGIRGRRVDMELTIRPGEELYRKFAVRFAQNETYQTSVSFRPYESILKIDRKFSGSRRAIIHQRRSKVRSEEGCLRLRLILDRFSAEVFVNDGEQVLSATLFTEQAADGISFFADGQVEMDVVKYDLISE